MGIASLNSGYLSVLCMVYPFSSWFPHRNNQEGYLTDA